MSIDWFRDLILCIFGLVATGVLIFLAVLSYLFYRRTRSILDILDSIKATSTTIQRISSYVGEEVVKPVIQVASMVQGVRQGIDTIGKFFKKQEGGKDV